MTTEERARFEVLLESIDTQVRFLADGHLALVEGQKKLEAGQAKLETQVGFLMDGHVALVAGQAKLEAGQARLEDGQRQILDRLDDHDRRLDAIEQHVGLNGAPPRTKSPPAKRPTTRKKR